MTEELLQGVRVSYVTDYYDGPLSGHAWYENRYCFFELEKWTDERRVYTLFEVPRLATLFQIAGRQLFEDTVGYGCTEFPDHKRPTSPKYVETYRAFWDDPYILNLRGNDTIPIKDHPKKKVLGRFTIN